MLQRRGRPFGALCCEQSGNRERSPIRPSASAAARCDCGSGDLRAAAARSRTAPRSRHSAHRVDRRLADASRPHRQAPGGRPRERSGIVDPGRGPDGVPPCLGATRPFEQRRSARGTAPPARSGQRLDGPLPDRRPGVAEQLRQLDWRHRRPVELQPARIVDARAIPCGGCGRSPPARPASAAARSGSRACTSRRCRPRAGCRRRLRARRSGGSRGCRRRGNRCRCVVKRRAVRRRGRAGSPCAG